MPNRKRYLPVALASNEYGESQNISLTPATTPVSSVASPLARARSAVFPSMSGRSILTGEAGSQLKKGAITANIP